MPYIIRKRRHDVDPYDPITKDSPDNAGELNFVLTKCIIDYLEGKGLSYQTCNDISGAMTECLAEFRRRVIVPYEKSKIKSNGDVY